jgi:Plant transposon protein
MDHSAFTDEYWEFFNPLDDDDAVTMDSAQHARAAAAVCFAVGTVIDADGLGPHGSIAGRKSNMNREFDVGVKRMMTDYFSETPTYDDQMFTRRFRMPRAVFDRIYKDVSAPPEFVHKCDALGKPGMHPLQRVVAALRKLSYGVASDAVDEYVRISESSAHESLAKFFCAVCELYGVGYGRQPTEDDLRRILKINANRVFPGCVGSFDFQHWSSEACPIQFAGQFKGKEKKPTIVLEAVADGECWIWHAGFGYPGSLNDLNILDISSTMERVFCGEFPPSFTFLVNNVAFKTAYFLADGIYHAWALFIKTIRNALSPKEKRSASAQEGVRKDVDRAFAALVARWHILKQPCRLASRDEMANVMIACILMNKMIVETGRDNYESGIYEAAESAADAADVDSFTFVWQDRASLEPGAAEHVQAWAKKVAARYAEFTIRDAHASLMMNLIAHRYGAAE